MNYYLTVICIFYTTVSAFDLHAQHSAPDKIAIGNDSFELTYFAEQYSWQDSAIYKRYLHISVSKNHCLNLLSQNPNRILNFCVLDELSYGDEQINTSTIDCFGKKNRAWLIENVRYWCGNVGGTYVLIVIPSSDDFDIIAFESFGPSHITLDENGDILVFVSNYTKTGNGAMSDAYWIPHAYRIFKSVNGIELVKHSLELSEVDTSNLVISGLSYESGIGAGIYYQDEELIDYSYQSLFDSSYFDEQEQDFGHQKNYYNRIYVPISKVQIESLKMTMSNTWVDTFWSDFIKSVISQQDEPFFVK